MEGGVKYLKTLLTVEDKKNISEIVGMNFEEIESKLGSLVTFLNSEKHYNSSLDIYGLHLVRAMIAYRLEEERRKEITEVDRFYRNYVENGVVVLNGHDFNSDIVQKLLKKCTLMKKLKFQAIKSSIAKHVDYDLQGGLHVDTFHNSVKVFQYKHDIQKEHGPFSYVFGSNRMTRAKMEFLYQASIRRSSLLESGLKREENREKWSASFRLLFDTYNSENINSELKKRGFEKETFITGEAGTIIIANVSGLHRRAPVHFGFRRVTDRWIFDRENPFKEVKNERI